MADLITGPITGDVVLEDTTVVNLDPPRIDIDGYTEEQVAEICHLIGLRYRAEGHPAEPPGVVFGYEPPPEFEDYVPNPDNPESIVDQP